MLHYLAESGGGPCLELRRSIHIHILQCRLNQVLDFVLGNQVAAFGNVVNRCELHFRLVVVEHYRKGLDQVAVGDLLPEGVGEVSEIFGKRESDFP